MLARSIVGVCVMLEACGHSSHGELDAGSHVRDAADASGVSDGAVDASPVATAGARRISAGYDDTCVILADGRVKCWGRNNSGQLGLGDTNNRGDTAGEMGANLSSVALGTGRTAVEVACGLDHVCALLDDASVKCWGFGGGLGLGDLENRGDGPNEMGDHLPALDLGSGVTPVQLAAALRSTCARFSDGRVKCWGNNSHGALGLGDTLTRGDQPGEMGDALPFVDLGTGRTAKSISGAVNDETYCAILDNDQLVCWGSNLVGELGHGDKLDRGDQSNEMGDHLAITDLSTATVHQVAAGTHACAIVAPDTIRCWGAGPNGELGNGAMDIRGDDPGEMGANLGSVPLSGTPLLVGADGATSCALTSTGLYCWGENLLGELGLGAATLDVGSRAGDIAALEPIDLGTTVAVSQLAVGLNHVCVLFVDGAVKCWGTGSNGATGLGTTSTTGDAAGEMGAALPFVDL